MLRATRRALWWDAYLAALPVCIDREYEAQPMETAVNVAAWFADSTIATLKQRFPELETEQVLHMRDFRNPEDLKAATEAMRRQVYAATELPEDPAEADPA